MKGSLIATISISWFSRALRATIRPIRPANPLIPTLTYNTVSDMHPVSSVERALTLTIVFRIARGGVDVRG
ncbi:hypothetical protein EDD17DRAFT_1586450 [Pisolithus thermaeus]|nr:hypothetical protein EDD17DRAFT_1586450 [Pisolithus thermaeus]